MENIFMVSARHFMSLYDKDGDGSLSREEMREFFKSNVLTRSNNNLSLDAFDLWFKRVDKDSNNLVSLSELQQCLITIDLKVEKKAIPPPQVESTGPIIMCKEKKYTLVRQLGQGAFGEVDLYKALDNDNPRKFIAVKMSKPN